MCRWGSRFISCPIGFATPDLGISLLDYSKPSRICLTGPVTAMDRANNNIKLQFACNWMLPYLPIYKTRIFSLIYDLKNGEGGHLIIAPRVKYITYKYFPEK